LPKDAASLSTISKNVFQAALKKIQQEITLKDGFASFATLSFAPVVSRAHS
jgi:hypothetical protein